MADVGVETIRFYEREGLLREPVRTANGYRQYPPEAVAQIEFIRRAKQLGFSLAEIRELLALGQPGGDRAQVKAMVEEKLNELDRRIRELQRMRAALAELDRQCSGKGPIKGCSVVDTLSGGYQDE
jgi:MerR family mercuric resistance operon transcriptional regulator